MAVSGVGGRLYKLVYTVSAVTDPDSDMTASITTEFAATAQSLSLTNGTHTLYFKSASSPGDFVISATSGDAGDTFTLDDLSLKEIQGGDAIVNGVITGGGTSGIKILSDGNVGIGDTAPGEKLDVAGNINIHSGFGLMVNDTQVVGSQQSGISAMTNVTAPSNWDADTVTTAQLADIVGTLIDKLRTHGLVTT